MGRRYHNLFKTSTELYNAWMAEKYFVPTKVGIEIKRR